MPRLLRIRALLAAAVTTTGFILAAPGAVLADCMAPPPIEESVETAEIVFVGTVVETSSNNTWASVSVEEIWRGPDLGKNVVVKGGPGGDTMTSVDRFFEAGVKYLFLPYVDQEQGGLADNSCTNTQPFMIDMAKLRPADARVPIEEAAAASQGIDLDALLPFALVGVVFVALLGIGLIARGRADA